MKRNISQTFGNDKDSKIPEGLWKSCDKCGSILYIPELKKNSFVCSKCSHHFKVNVTERIDITFDKDTYIIEAVNKDQKIVGLEDLSAGERQLLAISIVWTLSEVSKVNVPIVIDTPLGRLDSKHREQLITKYFPQAGAQTIILSTDEEIIGKYYKSLKPYIGNEYLCTENEKAQSGKILRGYFK